MLFGYFVPSPPCPISAADIFCYLVTLSHHRLVRFQQQIYFVPTVRLQKLCSRQLPGNAYFILRIVSGLTGLKKP
jgi:hypothetical protein